MEKLGLNYFDLVFAILLLWSAYRGITKGFIVMAASLAALILGQWTESKPDLILPCCRHFVMM